MGAGESKVQGHSQLHNELEGNRGFAGRRGEEEKGEEEEKRRGREGDGRREGGEGDGGGSSCLQQDGLQISLRM